MVKGYKAQSIQFAIMDVFTDNPCTELSIQDVYSIVQDYYDFSDYQKDDDPKCHHPRFHLEVSSILSRLKKEGFVLHRGRNRWVHIPEE